MPTQLTLYLKLSIEGFLRKAYSPKRVRAANYPNHRVEGVDIDFDKGQATSHMESYCTSLLF